MKICPICRRCYEDTESVCLDGAHGQLLPSRPGSRIIADKYRLERLLGRGGMGAVYAGTHVELERPAAIKLLLPDLLADQQALERFRREARAAARLNHPNVADTYDYGLLPGGEAYIVMELVGGQTLREYMNAHGSLPFGEAVQIARQVADGIEAAHRSGIIHRDLKPSNIILARDHHDALQAKVVDFGIAKLKEYSTSGGASVLTNTGSLLGTPRYMSPEQCVGHDTDARSDIYSLGIILYEMLAGRPPFDAPSATATALKHIQEPPPPLQSLRPDVPEALALLVMRTLEKEPDARPQTSAELARGLSALEDSPGGAHAQAASSVGASPGARDSSAAHASLEVIRSASVDSQTSPTDAPSTGAFHEGDHAGTSRTGSPTLQDVFEDGDSHDDDESALPVISQPPSEAETMTRLAAPAAVALPSPGKDSGAQNTPSNEPGAATRPPADASNAAPRAGERSASQSVSPGDASAPFASGDISPARSSTRTIIYAAIAVALLGVVAGILLAAPWREEDETGGATVANTSTSNDAPRADSPTPAASAPTPVSSPTSSAANVETGVAEVERRALTDSLEGWVAATNARDIDGQMSFYVPQLSTYYRSSNVARADVRRDKNAVFSQASNVHIKADSPRISFDRDGRTAVMEFRKQYVIEGGAVNSSGEVVQELIWQKTADGWKITGERDKRIIR